MNKFKLIISLMVAFEYTSYICTASTLQVSDPANIGITQSLEQAHIELYVGSRKWSVLNKVNSSDFTSAKGFTVLENNDAVSSKPGVKTFGDFLNGATWGQGVYFKLIRVLDYSKINNLSDLASGSYNAARTYAILAVSPADSNHWAITKIGSLAQGDDPSFVTPRWGFSYVPAYNIPYDWFVGFAIGRHAPYSTLQTTLLEDIVMAYNTMELQRIASQVKSVNTSITVPSINPKINVVQHTVPKNISTLDINLRKPQSMNVSQSYQLLNNSDLKAAIQSGLTQGIYLYPYLADMSGENIQKTMPSKKSWALWVAVYNAQGVMQGSYRLSKSSEDFTLPIKLNTFEFEYISSSMVEPKSVNVKYGKTLFLGPQVLSSSPQSNENTTSKQENNSSSSGDSSGFSF